jgi:hypothetical protein
MTSAISMGFRAITFRLWKFTDMEHSAGKGVDPDRSRGDGSASGLDRTQSPLFFVPAAFCFGKCWGTKPGPIRY